jgi:RNA polymerase sigma factor (sigma-70 family)
MDERTFTESVINLLPKLRAYGWALTRNTADTDDLVQETLYRALRYEDKFSQGSFLLSWLFTIMRNAHSTSVKKYRREQPGVTDCVSGNVVVEPEHDSVIAYKELWEAINMLPAQYRETLILVLVIGESYEDAARICNCTIGTVKSRVHRARHMVMQDLKPLTVEGKALAQDKLPRRKFG